MINLSKELIGNKDLLKNLINNFKNNSLHTSIIFNGSKGIGKTTYAFFFISKIFSSKDKNNINLIYNNTHPNIRYLHKKYDDKNNKLKSFISINQIRNLESFFYQSSFNNLPKFIIIDSADDLNLNSANSLLKILEEPKKNTYFIIISHNLSNLLPTMISRCIRYQIPKPDFNEFSTILNINNIVESNRISFLYSLTNSSPGLAIEISSDRIDFIYYDIIKIFLYEKLLSPNILNIANIVEKYSNDEFKIFLKIIKFFLMTMVKINLGVDCNLNKFSDIKSDILKAANTIQNSTTLEILEYINENENELFLYNLDKKIFCLNIFYPLVSKYE